MILRSLFLILIKIIKKKSLKKKITGLLGKKKDKSEIFNEIENKEELERKSCEENKIINIKNLM